MSTTTSNYYAAELAKLNADKYGQSIKVQFIGLEGKTKWLDLNKESASVIAEFLNKHYIQPTVYLRHYGDGGKQYYEVRDEAGFDPIGEAIHLDDAYLSDKRVMVHCDFNGDIVLEDFINARVKDVMEVMMQTPNEDLAIAIVKEVILYNYDDILDGSFEAEFDRVGYACFFFECVSHNMDALNIERKD